MVHGHVACPIAPIATEAIIDEQPMFRSDNPNPNWKSSGLSVKRLMPLHFLTASKKKLNSYGGNMKRAAIELAKDWRMDRYLRRLEAMLITCNKDEILMLSGTGDVIEPDHHVAAIGSGAMYAQAAALAMIKHAPNFLQKKLFVRV